MGRLRNTRGRNRRVTSVRERLRDAVGRVPAAFASLLPTVMLFGATALLPALAPATWEYLSSSPYLAVREVLVEGTRRLTPELVEDLVRTNSSGRILRLDEEALLEDLAQTGWVKEARIRRIPPGTVLVRLTENQPVATVLASGAHLVDRDGVPFRHVQPGERLTRPVLTGISNPASGLGRRALRRAIALVNDYRLSGMPRFDRLAEVHRDPARGYSLVTQLFQ